MLNLVKTVECLSEKKSEGDEIEDLDENLAPNKEHINRISLASRMSE
jgi:hypothetical protein